MADMTIDFSSYSPMKSMDDTCMDILTQMNKKPVVDCTETGTQVDLPKESRTIETQTISSLSKLKHMECQDTTKSVNKFASCVVKRYDATF